MKKIEKGNAKKNTPSQRFFNIASKEIHSKIYFIESISIETENLLGMLGSHFLDRSKGTIKSQNAKLGSRSYGQL